MNTACPYDTFLHTQKLKGEMRALIGHLRADAETVPDAKARAMFETAAEVVAGLIKAFDDHPQTGEPWATELELQPIDDSEL